MNRLAFLPLLLSLVAAPSAVALSARTVSTEQAQGTNGSVITLEVAPGYGLNINLIPTGEVVKKAWIDDPSRIVLSFDGNLCQSSGDSECNNEGATVIHLRQINPIAFPNLPRSPGGGTLLTLITESSEGRNIYQFKVVPVSGMPKYTVLSISPDVEQPSPVLPPALPEQNLPVVEAPNQVSEPDNTSQWQAQVTAPASQSNSIVSLPPQVTSTSQSVNPQQVEKSPNQNPNTSTLNVDTTPTATSTPEVAPSYHAISPPEKPVNPNAISPKQETVSDNSFALVKPEQKVATHTTSSLANNSSAKVPKLTITPPTNNSTSALSTVSSTPVSQSNNSIAQANTIVRGLVVARQQGQINEGTTTWKQVQSVVRLLRRGDSKQEAIKEVNIAPQLIEQLIIWGQRSARATTSK